MIGFDQAKELAGAHGTPLLLVSPNVVERNLRLLREEIPPAEIFYAMKANPSRTILEVLREHGAGIEAASPAEIEIALQTGFPADRILYSHPVRTRAQIAAAIDRGVEWFVYDSEYELKKLAELAPGVNTLLRISASNQDCVVRLSDKFGADPARAEELVARGVDGGLRMRGISFHVGSQTYNPYAYVEVILECRRIFNLLAAGGIELDTLDIGGGFPVPYVDPVVPIRSFCQPIRGALEAYFPGTRILSEPGRFISADAVTLVVSVISKCERSGTTWYFLDDGLYGSFSGMLYDSCRYRILSERDTPAQACVIAGPTCDSFDVICRDHPLPELEPGDLLLVPGMGAYTSSNVQRFNGLPPAESVRID